MKIAIDSSSLVISPFSGLSEVVRSLLLHLPLAAEDWQFHLFMNYFRGSKWLQNMSYPDTVNHFLCLPRRLVDLWWRHDWPPLEFWLKGMDIFHSLHIQVPPSKRMKRILTVHDCRFLAFPELYERQEVENYRRQMKTSLARVDVVATVSKFTQEELLTYFPISEDRIRVIHNGFSPHVPNADDGEEKVLRFMEENNLPETYLLYTGVLDPRKNLGRLIEAIAISREETGDFPDLVIAGISHEKWFKSDEAKRAGQLGLFDHIHLAGVVEKDILWKLTKGALALCYPSLYEGFGFPPLEAMSLGVPVLAGRSSSVPEVTGNAACLVDPMSIDDIARGLSKILYDTGFRQSLIELGYEQTKKFSWAKAAAEYISLYKEVLAS